MANSIMTNTSAMTALKTLNMTNKNLEKTQGHISTGYKVAEAADNAAYWSIATTMRSDNKALSTVQDALGLGKATVDVAYTGLNSAKDVLDEIKTKLVAAKQPGIDKAKIQSEVTQLKAQLEGIASAASFSGSNWLSVDSSSPGYTAVKEVVSSFARTNNGTLSVGKIGVDVSQVALYDKSAAGVGLLEQGTALTVKGGVKDIALTSGTDSPAAAATITFDAFAAMTMDNDDVISFSLNVSGGGAKMVTIDKNTINAALGTSANGTVATLANMKTVMSKALENAGIASTAVTVGQNAGNTAVTLSTVDTGATKSLEVTDTSSSSNGVSVNLADIDITSATSAQLDKYISAVDKMAAKVTTAASDLGAVKSRISMQTDFVKNLMASIDSGVGQLVDADMNEESTKLQALQVQQQLGIQALSIANGSAQSILSLFRG